MACPPGVNCKGCKSPNVSECITYDGPGLSCLDYADGDSINSLFSSINDKICSFFAIADRIPSVAGSNTEIQLNNNGHFGSSPDLTYDKTTRVFNLLDGNSLPNIQIDNVGSYFQFLGANSAATTLGYLAISPGSYALTFTMQDQVAGTSLLTLLADPVNGKYFDFGFDGASRMRVNTTYVSLKNEDTGAMTTTPIELRFYEKQPNGNNYVGLVAPDSLSGDLTYVWPTTAPTAGQKLTAAAPSAGKCVLSWT